MRPFRIAFPDEALTDLRDRLARTRWPAQLDVGWSRGVPVDYLRGVVDYWLHSYDWRRWEARLIEFPQYLTEIDGQTIHFLHVRSKDPSALPLLVTHGWPGSFVELVKIIEPLAESFHVVVPSVPGFGFSTPLSEPGWNHHRIALAWAELMRRLGYSRYGTQGGDTGSVVSPEVGRVDPDHVVGVHINGGLAFPSGDLTDLERERLAFAYEIKETGTGYADLQSTRPHTLSFALNDSPVGQLAWIIEKFREWTDPARELPEDAVDLDLLLTNVTLYWLTGTGATSAHLYYETRIDNPDLSPSGVPTAVAIFPTDPAIRRLVEREHNVVRWTEFDRGGHFAALEAPDLLVEDIRAFFGALETSQC
ncbi:epoxide hydrolase family protein [Fodinicola acaciae]|uniref:epoxide hydrolase family protein n=1 Tax=Fodinicola acaciae TaxID=2681555 RepID=UPI0013D554E7|nr:epoxide hydrolase family protein [Fodinicola acaciae]